MIDLILHAVTFVAWFAFMYPPLALSKNKAAQTARHVIAAVLGACIGYGLGNAIAEVFLR